jgi:protein-disulfide isomerase
MKRLTVILNLAILICGVACVALAQSKPPLPDGAAKPTEPTAKSSDAISHEQADAILAELRAIRQLLQRQEARVAAPELPRAAAPPERVSVSLADAGQWYAQGKEDAPVTIVEFTDYQCPYCRRFDQGTFADLKKNYIDTGKVRFLSRDLPLEFHSNAQRAAEAARCAGDQGKFWEMRSMLFAGSELSREAILKNAQSLPLDAAVFAACVDSEKHKAEITADLAESTRLHITGTPTFLVGKSGKDVLEGAKINGALPLAAFDAAIRQALAAAQ